MRAVKERIGKVARSMAPVLVRGESGTGKGAAARALHTCSHRADGPFVAVNCSAIPENLLEAEFFGARKVLHRCHSRPRGATFRRRGAAPCSRRNRRPAADHAVQAAARHQERQVGRWAPPGRLRWTYVSSIATHKDLAADVHAGRFRQDLYYRLNVIEIIGATVA